MRRFTLLCVICILGAFLAAPAAGQEKARMTTGAVESVDPEASLLVLLKDDGEKVTFQVEPTAVIRLHGPKGKLGSLKKGDIVTVTYVSREGKLFASQIQHM
jgi:Cu/Ag efflux protein CusF